MKLIKVIGVDCISAEQIDALKGAQNDIDFDKIAGYERKFRHDVMAHVHAFGDVAPSARGIIHLGATSQFLNCNCDMITYRAALRLIGSELASLIDEMALFAEKWKNLPCLGFTHYQPAQLVTVGKRAALWTRSFVLDFHELEHRLQSLEFRGAKGTTGTQASFLALFDGKVESVLELDKKVCEAFGFGNLATVTGQTYDRKADAFVASVLAGIGVSVHKFCNDVRLLSHDGELEEPFEENQVGSSAMAYKQNPMRCERATGLVRFLIGAVSNPLQTAAEQWLERTLDDSSNKRLAMPEMFLATDAALRIVRNVIQGLRVNPVIIARNIQVQLPFMATENLLMLAVQAGGDRQVLHECIRMHSLAAKRAVRAGESNPLIGLLRSDALFKNVDVESVLDPNVYIGLCVRQVESFIQKEVAPIRQRYAAQISSQEKIQLKV